ncbi:uncharacterized protein LOC133849777 [Drosophila sulfurigaster albostrigata]|uniref:uncharacterized protein LOC133849777 n=1 Tax=Drosophila sulfurigaster albostrigata TaxID=89887 RepID=UPI002D21C331|nr:uncharacterized protein LOC133849777 [Drosophila sulfurigaster albostrigata]
MENFLKLQDFYVDFDELVDKLTEYRPLPLLKKSPSVWAYERHGCFWERDVLGSSESFFIEHFRMNREEFGILVERLCGLAKKDTEFRRAIPLDKRIAIALYTLGSSAEYRTVGTLFGVSTAMVCKIFLEFCHETCRFLSTDYLPHNFLTQSKLEECVKGFEELGSA